MAKVTKFETIEAAAEAMGVELNDQTRPFLGTFVIKNKDAVNPNARKKALFEKVVALGVEGLELDKETMDSLKLRGCMHLFGEARLEELDQFAAEYNLAVNHETGAVHRLVSPVKPIEQRNAGQREGTVGWVTIQMLQDPEFAGVSVQEIADGFVDYAAALGYELKPTTTASIQWYINYCRKKGIEICERKSGRKSKGANEPGLGAELTLEAALAPRAFKKKAKPAEAPVDGLEGSEEPAVTADLEL